MDIDAGPRGVVVEGHDPAPRAADDERARDFIELKATLIREYSSRKDKLRQQYRHFKIGDEELLREYTALVRWYIHTRRDLQTDFHEYEWECDERTDVDANRIAKTEVDALIELRRAGHTSLSGGSSVDRHYLQSIYSVIFGAGGKTQPVVHSQIEIAYTSEADRDQLEFWPVWVVARDEEADTYTVAGRYDKTVGDLQEAQRAAENSSEEDDGYYKSEVNFSDCLWQVPGSA